MSLSKQLSIGIVTFLLGASGCHQDDAAKASLPPKSATAGVAESAKASGNGAVAAQPTPEAATKVAEPAASETPAPVGQPPQQPAAEYRLTGQIAAVRRAQLGFRVSGYIKSVSVRPGSAAKAGEVLAALDDRDFILRVELAKVRRDNAKVQLAEAEKELKRELQLQKDNASTAMTFDKVKSGTDQARLGLQMAELDLQMATDALKDTKLTAPYDCVVVEQLKYEGEGVQPVPPAPVLEIYDQAEPEISLSAPERLMGKIKLGDSISVSVPSGNFTGKATVTRIVPVINDKTRTFTVFGKFQNFDKKVVAGSYAEGTLD